VACELADTLLHLVDGASNPLRVAACCCTYRRNEPLTTLLTRFAEISDASEGSFTMGVVVVDDNPDQAARAVVDRFAARFPLGVRYRHSGKGNISVGRNMLLDAAQEFADVMVMTDDDCLPEPQWVQALIDTMRATNADSVSGPMLAIVPADAPRWVTEQGVFGHETEMVGNGERIAIGQTNNCLISVPWLRQHPEHRFDEAFGKIGGEDMVFFKQAIQLGLRSHFSTDARAHAVEPIDELRLGALLRSRFWWGNSEAVVNLHCREASRARLAGRGLRRLAATAAEPLLRLARRQPAHVRRNLVSAARAAGLVAGAAGLRLEHH
jgi:succinoglycan biosynthesis protein ExoM